MTKGIIEQLRPKSVTRVYEVPSGTLPVKVRYFFAVGPTDWRGLYKPNVAWRRWVCK